MGSREPRRPDTYIPMVSRAGIPSSAHVSIRTYSFYTSCSVLGLRSVMTTALDSDERLHSEVGLKQERETDLDIVQSAYGRVETENGNARRR